MKFVCTTSIDNKQYFYKQYKSGKKVPISSSSIKGELPSCEPSTKSLLAQSLLKIEDLKRTNSTLNERLQLEIQNCINNTSKNLDINLKKIKALQQQKGSSDEVIKRNNQLIKFIQDENKNLKSQLQINIELVNSFNLKNKSLENSNSSQSREILELKNTVNRQVAEKTYLENQLRTKNQELVDSILKNDKNVSEIQSIEGQILSLKEEIKIMQLRHQTELEKVSSQNVDLNAKALSLQGQINILETNIELIKSEYNNDLEGKDGLIQKLQDELELSTSKLIEYQNLENLLRDELQTLKIKGKDKDDEILIKEELLLSVKAEVTSLAEVVSTLQSDLESRKLEQSGMNDEINLLKERLAQKSLEFEETLEKQKRMESSLTRVASLKDNEIKSLKQDISQAQRELEKLKSDLSAFEKASKPLTSNNLINQKDKKISSQFKQLKEKAEIEVSLRNEIAKKEKEIFTLQDEVNKFERTNNLLNKDLSSLRLKLTEIEQNCQNIRENRGQKIQSLVKQMNENNKVYEKYLSELYEQKIQLEDKLNKKSDKIKEILENSLTLKREFEETDRFLRDKKHEINILENKIESLKQYEKDSKTQKVQIDYLTQQINEKNGEINKIKIDYENKLKILQIDLTEAKEQSTNHMKEIENQSRLYSELQSTISILESKSQTSDQKGIERGLKIGLLVEEHRKTRKEYFETLKKLKNEQIMKEKEFNKRCELQMKELSENNELRNKDLILALDQTKGLLEKQIEFSNSKDATIKDLQEKNTIFMTKNIAELAKLQSEISTLKQTHSDELKNLIKQTEIDSETKKNDIVRNLKSELEDELNSYKKQAEEKESEYSITILDLTKKITDLEKQLDSQKTTRSQSEFELDKFRENNSLLTGNLSESNQKVQALTQQLYSVQLELESEINNTSKHFEKLCLGSQTDAESCIETIYEKFNDLRPKPIKNDLLCFENQTSGSECLKKILNVFPNILALNIVKDQIVSFILEKEGNSYEIEFSSPIKIDINNISEQVKILPLVPLNNELRQIIESSPKELKIKKLQAELEESLKELEPLKLKIKNREVSEFIEDENKAKIALDYIRLNFPNLFQPGNEEKVIELSTEKLLNIMNKDDYSKMKKDCQLFYQQNFSQRGLSYLENRLNLGIKPEEVCYTAVSYVKNKPEIKKLIDKMLETKGKKFTKPNEYNNHFKMCQEIANSLLGPEQLNKFNGFVAKNTIDVTNLTQQTGKVFWGDTNRQMFGKEIIKNWCNDFGSGVRENLS